MLKWQKKDIFEITDVLTLAHDEIRKVIKLSRFDIVSELSTACIECAENVKNIVSDDKITEAVSSYIKAVKSFNKTNSVSALDEQLNTLINIIDTCPIKKEILFLPYNSSMWDCLHTVYLAAKADDCCEVFVVPIPYFSFEFSTQTLGELHHEINEFPKDVEVTHYKNYNLEKRCPDMIFIHNPYDNQNIITRIAERFYCVNLRKYTKSLIYIPYFVAGKNIEKTSVVVQGVLLADKVIVESENTRKLYMDILLENRAEIEEYMQMVCDEEYFENKFAVFGSSKLELATRSKREDFDIPEKWLKKIQKPDGSYKKVVFYNTSVQNLLLNSTNSKENEENDLYFSHLEYIFEIFSKRKDIVLWWRPHPLLSDTILSIRPLHYDRYKNIVKKFSDDDFGIYDDTSDLNRAIAWSDLCYGDASSIKILFSVSGKPVFDQVPRAQGFIQYSYSRMDVYNNKIYFMARFSNRIFEFDPKTDETRFFGMIPDITFLSNIRFLSVQIIESKMYIFPFNSTEIYIFDFNTRTYETIHPNLKDEFFRENTNLYIRVLLYKNKLFFIPNWYKSMFYIDLNTKETHHFGSESDIFYDYEIKCFGGFSYVFIDEHTVLIPILGLSNNSTALLKVNLENLTISTDFNSMNNNHIKNIFRIEGDIYLADGVNMTVFKKQADEYQNICNLAKNEDFNLSGLFQTVKCGKYIFMICNYPRTAYKINIENGESQEFHAFDKYYEINEKTNREEFNVTDSTVIGNKIYFMYKAKHILEFNTINETIRELPIIPTYKEHEIEDLENNFLDNIINGREFADIDFIPDNIGENIFNYCKGLIK